jgi:hypothetical protein
MLITKASVMIGYCKHLGQNNLNDTLYMWLSLYEEMKACLCLLYYISVVCY